LEGKRVDEFFTTTAYLFLFDILVDKDIRQKGNQSQRWSKV